MSTSAQRSYFVPAGPGRYQPTEHVQGAWREDEQHVSPLAGLLVHHLETHREATAEHAGATAKTLSRVTFDILGPIAREEIALEMRVLRGGRSVELVQAAATIAGRPTVTARAWYLLGADSEQVAGTGLASLPEPDALEVVDLTRTWPGGYIHSLTARAATAAQPGRRAVWVRTDTALVAGEQVGALARYVALIDTANGIAVRADPERWLFPNVDLTVHLFRTPAPPWVGLDTTVSFGPAGQGLTSTVLHDATGPVGTAQQSLLLRPR